MQIIRATRTPQQAGAYYVRIQAMARKHHITLDAEFDEHDTPQTKYIVIVDDYLPIATCRLYAIDEAHINLGRVVVLPEYRGQGLGSLVVREAENWARERGFKPLSWTAATIKCPSMRNWVTLLTAVVKKSKEKPSAVSA